MILQMREYLSKQREKPPNSMFLGAQDKTMKELIQIPRAH